MLSKLNGDEQVGQVVGLKCGRLREARKGTNVSLVLLVSLCPESLCSCYKSWVLNDWHLRYYLNRITHLTPDWTPSAT